MCSKSLPYNKVSAFHQPSTTLLYLTSSPLHLLTSSSLISSPFPAKLVVRISIQGSPFEPLNLDFGLKVHGARSGVPPISEELHPILSLFLRQHDSRGRS